MSIQNYEDYWSLTNAFTNYDGVGFISTLKISVEFIDEFKDEPYSEEKYERLQLRVQEQLGINQISVRKAINQLVKMDFIKPFLVSYNSLAKEYYDANSNKKRQILLSKIVYSNFCANRAITVESDINHLNFLVKILIEFGKLTKTEITGLMLVDLISNDAEILSYDAIAFYEKLAIDEKFYDRKYNQVDHFCNLLGKLDDLVFIKNVLYFKEDAKRIFGDELKIERRLRDPYLHRLYKNQLQEESIYHLDDTKCMVEKIAYPVLIASHIKPFINCLENLSDAYDPNNGILLSRNMDSLFDLGYITFDDAGEIIFANQLKQEVRDSIAKYSLDKRFINPKRVSYLEYHRNEVFEKRYKYA